MERSEVPLHFSSKVEGGGEEKLHEANLFRFSGEEEKKTWGV